VTKFIDSAILLAVCTALLFSWSTAHYHGFLVTAHLDSDLMERSFHQVIYSGLVLAMLPLFLTLFTVSALLYCYSHMLLPEYVNLVRRSYKAKRKVIKLRKFWIGKRVAPEIEKVEKKRFNNYFILFAIATSFLLSLIYFENKGQNHAKETLELHKKNETISKNIILVPYKNGSKTLHYLGCGSKNCAGIEPKTNRIYYFSQAVGFSFVHAMKI